jgi:hypothetical protein
MMLKFGRWLVQLEESLGRSVKMLLAPFMGDGSDGRVVAVCFGFALMLVGVLVIMMAIFFRVTSETTSLITLAGASVLYFIGSHAYRKARTGEHRT